MKLRDLKKLLESASDDTEIKVKDGEIVISEPKPIEYKFKVGDKVRDTNNPELIYTVIKQFTEYGEPMYRLKGTWGETSSAEKWLTLIPQDITERIKTFIDAWAWCNENGKEALVDEYDAIIHSSVDSLSDDILAYLQLRIITAALNEGWEPSESGQEVCIPRFVSSATRLWLTVHVGFCGDSAKNLCFKAPDLAEYAATQFRDIYADFCDCKKGGEE